MNPQAGSNKPPPRERKKTLLGWFVSREEPDTDYLPDLKTQWADIDRPDRIKFILGGIFSAVLFIAALVLIYFILAAIVGWLGLG